jgi:hypothetical protein
VSETIDRSEHVFTRSDSLGNNAVLWLVGGLAALGFTAIGFCVSLFSRAGQLSLHLTTTLPASLSVGALIAAWSFARTPRQVSVGPGGISIQGRRASQSFGWHEIGLAMISPLSMTSRRRLVIFGANGKTIAKIDDGVADFDRLAYLVKQRIAEKGDDASDQIRRRKARLSALLTGTISMVMILLSGGLAWMTHSDQEDARALKEHGVQGQAEIVRRFLAPDGITPRLEYQVTTPDGRTGTCNAQVLRPIWDALDGQTTVPVIYVPDKPDNSRLAHGEAKENDLMDNPTFVYVLCAAIAVVCLAGLALAGMQWKGWSLGLDSKTGKLSIKPFGTGEEGGKRGEPDQAPRKARSKMTHEELCQSIDEERGTRELEIYLQQGGDLLVRNVNSGRNLLHLACEHQNLKLIRELVGRGVPIDDADEWGQTPLHIAVNIDIDSVVQGSGQISEMTFRTTNLLLSLGANPTLQDKRGRTP